VFRRKFRILIKEVIIYIGLTRDITVNLKCRLDWYSHLQNYSSNRYWCNKSRKIYSFQTSFI